MRGTLELFSDRVRAAGENLYFASAVTLGKLVFGPEGRLVSEVADDRTYRVRIESRAESVGLACACGQVAATHGCAHLWATLLEANDDAVGREWLRERFSLPVLAALDQVLPAERRGSPSGEPAATGAGTPTAKANAKASAGATRSNAAEANVTGGDPTATPAGTAAAAAKAPEAPAPPVTIRPPSRADWRSSLSSVQHDLTLRTFGAHRIEPTSVQPLAVRFLVVPGTTPEFPVELEILGQRRTQSGAWGKLRPVALRYADLAYVEDPGDLAVLRRLLGAQDARIPDGARSGSHYLLRTEFFAEIAPGLAARGRLCIVPPAAGGRSGPARAVVGTQELRRHEQAVALGWDDGLPFHLELRLEHEEFAYRAELALVRAGTRIRAADVVFFPCAFAAVGPTGAEEPHRLLRVDGEIPRTWARAFPAPLVVPPAEVDEFLRATVSLPGCPALDAPAAIRWTATEDPPVPRLVIELPEGGPEPVELVAQVEFDYGGTLVTPGDAAARVVDAERRAVVTRQMRAESDALRVLASAGIRRRPIEGGEFFVLPEARLSEIVTTLLAAGWQVLAADAILRMPSCIQTMVSSGIDWFAVKVSVTYEGANEVDLLRLLAARRRGQRLVRLGDGTVGFLPEEWLRRNEALLELGQFAGDEIRFGHGQAALLDALLAEEPEVDVDARFAEVRDALRSFQGITAVEPPPTFRAHLRDYQKASLGWFQFLRSFGFGGCLADDMGLGKTVMVLALLDSRRSAVSKAGAPEDCPTLAAPEAPGTPENAAPSDSPDAESRPSLVVVPRSLVFNWKLEAKRFAPRLRILDHSGARRDSLRAALGRRQPDIVLTTYGVLRTDILEFRDVLFDYAILDESQAIKNEATATAKAVRLLQARHRLAMSGTPIENHVGELWSLFAFLNPGLLGSAQRFQSWALTPVGERGGSSALTPASRSAPNLLAAAVRPFVLRRTKSQVAPQLPAKEEQTVWCTLGKAQRRAYETLRVHYQALLLGEEGVAPMPARRRSGTRLGESAAAMRGGRRAGAPEGEARALLVLEGLLRLRQAACHPGLLDPKRATDGSAKLDLLVERLRELRAEGHKALVFSQFVSFLTYVKRRLDAERIRYEYLDGQTRDRAEHVARFQEDPSYDVFLISLKAGGTGLNLTAASYVFLLDPWWNPAVEAQAIDRTHRIGQTRPVLACRLVARDTVEERILELQEKKRELADSIIQADRGLLQNLQREDLELLLS